MLPQRLEERRAWLRRGFAAAVEHAIVHGADLFLQAGDLFDSPEPRNAERQFVAGALARLRAVGIPCIAIGGNHDTPRARNGSDFATPHGAFARLGGMRLLEGRGAVDAETADVQGLRVAVGGLLPDPAAPPGSDPLEGVEWRPEADLALLLFHGSLEGQVYPGAPEPIVRRETVAGLEGVDLLVAGHTHRHATFRWGGTTVVVPGATERMTFAEMEATPGFVVVEVEPGRTPLVRHVAVEPQPRRQARLSAAELPAEDPAGALRSTIEGLADPAALVRLCLEGPVSRHRYHELHPRELAEHGAARCFFFALDTTGLYLESDLPRGGARGGRLSQREELIRFAREAREAAAPGEERALVDEALALVLEEYS